MTKALNSLEKHLTAFVKLEEDQALAARVKKKAIEISETPEKLEKKKIENAADELRGVYYECRKELEMDKYQAIEKLDNNIDEYLERYETLKETKDETLTRPEHAFVQEIKSTTSNITEQTPIFSGLTGFTAHTAQNFWTKSPPFWK